MDGSMDVIIGTGLLLLLLPGMRESNGNWYLPWSKVEEEMEAIQDIPSSIGCN